MMSIVAGIALWVSAWIGISAIARTAVGARLSAVLVLAVLPLPWLVHAPYPHRVMLAFAFACLFLSAVDFAAGRRPATFAARLRYVLGFCALIDSTTAVNVDRHFDRGAVRRIVIDLCAGALAAASWIAASALPATLRIPLRMCALAALVLVLAELDSNIIRLLSAACGVHFAAVHFHPYRSRTITEFWSRRWNLLGARWFRQHAFLPLRARGVTLALFTLFGVSAAIHVYLIASVVPARWMAMCAAFFLSQPVLIIIERRLRVRTWPTHAARIWTFALLIALLPLLLTPLLAALEFSL
jgi:hypothetical protein